MFAVIKTGGKQYLVSPGQKIKIEKLSAQEGEIFTFPEVLLWSDGEDIEIGTPLLKREITGKVLRTAKGEKKLVFKYRPKKRYRKKKGHRQPFTEIEILGLTLD